MKWKKRISFYRLELLNENESIAFVPTKKGYGREFALCRRKRKAKSI